MGGKKKGRSLKKNPKVDIDEGAEFLQAPHSFVIHRGLACPYIQDLTKDFRRIMEPFTAINLKERKSNKIKDFVSLSGHFHVSHICIFNKATTQLSFKVVRLPRGPTLTFKVHQFTLSRDVIASSRKQFVDEESFHQAPLVIMNNFAGEGKHLKLIATTFQNMFPTINIATVNLSTIKRCVLFSYNPVTKLTDMRHYSVIVVPVGLSRGVKKVVLGKIPNLSRCEDIADLFTQGALSDSEFEDDEASQVILPQDLKRKGNLENNKSAIRLYEIGPRLTFELIKIEDALLTGEVLYHEVIVKSEQEIEEIRKQREKKKKLKEHRKKTQTQNTIVKDQRREMIKNKSNTHLEREVFEVEPDNDAQYYKDEVGEEPDGELFKSSDHNRKRVRLPRHMMAQSKKRKLEDLKGDKRNKSNDSKLRSFDSKTKSSSLRHKDVGLRRKSNDFRRNNNESPKTTFKSKTDTKGRKKSNSKSSKRKIFKR